MYNQGIISYPRTETDVFADNFQLKPLIEKQIEDARWGEYAQSLLEGKFRKPRNGKSNDQAHPPIHPVRAAHNLEGDEKRVFDFITRRFLACCSEAARGQQTTVRLSIGNEIFTANGLMVLERNYLDVYTLDGWGGNKLPVFTQGERIRPTRLEMHESSTAKPPMLSEAELITLMDKSGIGTDATIHEHIKKIIDRNYATKENGLFYPTTLGMALVTAYDAMDIELSLSKPALRSLMESNMNNICTGTQTPAQVVKQTVEMYQNAFQIAQAQSQVLLDACAKYMTIQDAPANVN